MGTTSFELNAESNQPKARKKRLYEEHILCSFNLYFVFIFTEKNRGPERGLARGAEWEVQGERNTF